MSLTELESTYQRLTLSLASESGGMLLILFMVSMSSLRSGWIWADHLKWITHPIDTALEVTLVCKTSKLTNPIDMLKDSLKDAVGDSGERLLVFELNSQRNDTPPFCAPEAMCILAGIVYISVQATMFVFHLQSQDCVCFWVQQKLFNRQLEDLRSNLLNFIKKVYWIRIADFTVN